MMKRNKLLLALISMFIFVLIIAGCSSNDEESSGDGGSDSSSDDGEVEADEGGVIKIGVPQPLTGPSAAEGKDMVNGAELAVKHINDEGGVLGKQIELVVEDAACDPQVAVTAANKLVSDEVNIIVGHYCSGAALPAIGIYNKAEIPSILVGANSPQIPEQGYDNVFLINSMVADQGRKVTEFFEENDVKKIALVHDNSDYARDLVDITKEMHEANGGEVVAFEAVNPEEKDFGALATKLKSIEPDATYFTGFYNAGGLIIKQFKQKDVSGYFIAGDGNPLEPFMEVAGEEDSEGVIFSIPVSINLVDTPEAQAFMDEYEETYGGSPLTFGHREYDGIRLAVDAIERAGTADDKGAIIQALKETSDFEAFGETYNFNDDGTRENADYLLLTIKSGDFEVVE